MDDRRLVNVYFRPNSNKKPEDGYWPVPHFDPSDPPVQHDISFRSMWYGSTGKAMRTVGCPEEEIEAAFREWFKSYNGPRGRQ